MLTFEQFEKYIKFLQDSEQKNRKVKQALKEINTDFLELHGLVMPYETKVKELLALAMNVPQEELDWWITEADYGKYFTSLWVPEGADNRQKEVDVSTTEKYYNYLVSQYVEKKRK